MKYTEENYKSASPTDTFDFSCKYCGKLFTRTKREIQKNSGNIPQCCSQKCARANNDLGCVKISCAECGKVKIIKVSEYNKSESKRFFCDSSCAAKYNNKKYPKRHKNELHKDECPQCGRFKSLRSHLCQFCSQKAQSRIQNSELGEYIGYGEQRLQYITTKCQSIRKHAKKVLNNDKEREKVCAYCKNHEFDDILEVHHLKPISSFNEHTRIKDINDISNLVWLCPNHHAMLEKGLIRLS